MNILPHYSVSLHEGLDHYIFTLYSLTVLFVFGFLSLEKALCTPDSGGFFLSSHCNPEEGAVGTMHSLKV